MRSIGRLFRRIAAISVALVLLTSGTAIAADPDTEPPITFMDQLSARIGWTSVDVTFRTLFAEPDATFECKLDAGPWLPCVSPWELRDLTEGVHDVAVRATDAAGNTDPTPETATFEVDLTGPVGQLAINDGAATTGRSQVRLTMSNSDLSDTLHIRVSNRPDVDDLGQLLYAWDGYQWQLKNYSEYAWDLANTSFGGMAATGVRTVYVQFYDNFGNVGAVTSDSITYTPGITPVIVKVGVTENPAEAGGLIGIRATVTAADGAGIRDGVFSLGGCQEGSPRVEGRGQRELVLECYGWSYAAGSVHVQASFIGSSELEYGGKSFTLQVGPANDLTPPRIFVGLRSSLDDGDTVESFDIHSTHDEAVHYDCRIDGGPWTTCGPIWSVARPGRGFHLLEARGHDSGGRWNIINGIMPWRIEPTLNAGGLSFDDTQVNGGYPTRDPIMGIKLWLPDPTPTAVRISSSWQLDAQGRLAKAIEIQSPNNDTSLEWDTEDPVTGGTAGDGWKWVVLQWRAPDGTWDIPQPFAFRVDRSAPSLRLVLNANEPFVDDDEIMILPKSNEANEISVMYSTNRADLEGNQPHSPIDPSLGFWKVDDVAPGSVATKTLYARAIDLAGNMSPIVSDTITIDRSAPTGALYSPSFVVGSRVTTTSVPVRIGAITTDTGSGVARTTLQEAVGTSSFVSVATSSATKVSVVRNLRPTVSRTYRVRANDRLGHLGAWRLGPSLRPSLRNGTSAAITYGSGWRRVTGLTAIGSDVMRSAISGARMDFQFTGRAVAIIAPTRSSLGRAKVYIDGRYVSTVDLRSGSTGTQKVVFASHWTTPGSHRLTIRVLATSGHPFDLDAVAVIP